MKPIPLSRGLGALLCALVATGSWALSLGRAQGLAMVGRPLEVSVPVQFDAVNDPLPECVDAEVFYGDSRIAPARVSAELVTGRAGASVRVRSLPAIDEPVVTLYLHLGCSSRLTRKVVLLAEQPDLQGEVPRAVAPAAAVAAAPPRTAASVRPAAPAAPERRRAAPVPPAPAATAPASRARRTAAGAEAAAAAAAPAAPAAVTRPRTAGGDSAPEPAKARARLKLLPPDAPIADPKLRFTDTLAAPEGSQAQRAAAAALWRALTADPDTFLRDSQRLAALERDVAGLRQAVQKSQAQAGELQVRLQEAEARRYSNPLVWGLVLALLAALAAAAVLWRRSRGQHRQWWNAPSDPDSAFSGLEPLSVSPPSPPAPAPARAKAKAPVEHRAEVDLDLGFADSAPAPVAASLPELPATASRFEFGDDTDQGGVSLRSLKAEELHDVQQEADFFMAIGDHERAIESLRAHIGMNPETSAVAWLDLLEIYHAVGRQEEFEYTRGEFERQFNARVPAFAQYREHEGPGLEGYGNAMARICALWPSRRVLDLIEESIFRPPGDDGRPAFSLEAYRELLLLHHIGEEILGREVAPSSFGSLDAGRMEASLPAFSSTNIHPLSAAPSTYPQEHDGFTGIGLDVDLEEVEAAAPRAPAPPPSEEHLLDFDLPEIDFGALKKTRE